MKQSGLDIMTKWIIQSRENIENTDNTKICEISRLSNFFFIVMFHTLDIFFAHLWVGLMGNLINCKQSSILNDFDKIS